MTTQAPLKPNPEAEIFACFYCAKTAIEFLPEAVGDISRPVCRTHYDSKRSVCTCFINGGEATLPASIYAALLMAPCDVHGALQGGSSAVEHRPYKPAVVGSIPTLLASPPTLTLHAPEQGALFAVESL